MLRALKAHWIAAACVVFTLLNAALMAADFYWFSVLPAVLLVIWAMVATPQRLLLFIAFATPLSINLEELSLGGIGVALPTEPILVGLMFLFLLKISIQKGVIDHAILRHPITTIILLQLGWMAVCIVPSSMPMVSFKYFTARAWFVCVLYFMGTRFFAETPNMLRFVRAFLAGLVVAIGYTLIHHAQFGFAQDPAHWVMWPFFKDHTSYGAVIAFMVPFAITLVGLPEISRTSRGVMFFTLLVLVAGLIFSYTRAAWLSLMGPLAVFLFMRLRIPVWVLASLLAVSGVVYWVNADQITIYLERNREESSDDLGQHVQSISNISSDASNLERINRWHSALRMFQERPIFGWGPGTYMFQYAPFQASEDRTIISTNFGVQGNAHSEYLGPLSEQGLLGMLLMVALVVVTTARAVRLYKRMPPGTDRRVMSAAFLGLVTYYLHGGLNNFLDTDKASVPFWAFTAMIVLFDVKYSREPEAAIQAA
ncbi:MAG: O-antigen ligase family protein [Flavobacteriales bacterium]|nr:O-antigen ligase family protein [Flavobacteriales bacterium]MCC6936793.1 O-antigen ligase family protein [Flavobacteriales bacterium]